MRNMLSATAILLSSFVVLCLAQQPSVRIKVTNPSAFSRQGETISVNWTELARFLPKDSKSMIVKEESLGRELLSQLFDSNLDGKPEELLFQADFAPKQTKVYSVSGSGQAGKEVTSLVDARFVEPRQDLAWENDRIAFRMYGPALAAEVDNGIDVWTKRVRSLIVK